MNPWPGARSEVWSEDGEGAGITFAHNGGSVVRIEAEHPEAGAVRCFLRTGSSVWVEAVCPNGAGAYVWTRKRVVPVACDIRIGDRRIEVEATGIEDESAGYHPRHTVWSWSAGVGRLTDGRSVGWNLVEGVNDPPERSERAIWVDGEPLEPGPVSFDGLDAVTFDDGSRLDFAAEAERVATEDRRLVRIAYRQPFGTFTGALAGGLRLERGLGVMEHQDAPGSSHPAYTLATRQRHGGSSPGGKSTWLRPASVSSGTSRGWSVSKSGVIACAATCAASAVRRICSQPSVGR